jgi:hypothetical protein
MLFRFSKREFNEDLIRRGKIRITPASYYGQERHGPAQRDDELRIKWNDRKSGQGAGEVEQPNSQAGTANIPRSSGRPQRLCGPRDGNRSAADQITVFLGLNDVWIEETSGVFSVSTELSRRASGTSRELR